MYMHFKTALFSRPAFLFSNFGIVKPGLRKLAFINSGHSVHTSEINRKLDEHLYAKGSKLLFSVMCWNLFETQFADVLICLCNKAIRGQLIGHMWDSNPGPLQRGHMYEHGGSRFTNWTKHGLPTLNATINSLLEILTYIWPNKLGEIVWKHQYCSIFIQILKWLKSTSICFHTA